MAYNIQQLKLGLGYLAQDDIATANTEGQYWKLSAPSYAPMTYSIGKESDADDIGKGSEFPSAYYFTNKDVSLNIEKPLSSQMAAWAFQYGFGTANGTVTADGATGFVYTVTPMDVCDGLELPYFSVIEQLGEDCGTAVVDRKAVGCALNSFNLNFTTGPGRNNTMLQLGIVGSGRMTEPSAVELPAAALSESLLKSSSATVSINGIDLVANKSLLSVNCGFNNNLMLDKGFYIGSGTEDGAAVRGRLEMGKREYTLSYVARLEAGSAEYAALKAQTQGTATITFTGAAYDTGKYHSLSLAYKKVEFSTVELGTDDGIVTVAVNCGVMQHPTTGVIEVVTKTNIGTIGS